MTIASVRNRRIHALVRQARRMLRTGKFHSVMIEWDEDGSGRGIVSVGPRYPIRPKVPFLALLPRLEREDLGRWGGG